MSTSSSTRKSSLPIGGSEPTRDTIAPDVKPIKSSSAEPVGSSAPPSSLPAALIQARQTHPQEEEEEQEQPLFNQNDDPTEPFPTDNFLEDAQAEEDEDDDEIPYEPPSPTALLPPADFQPFFTLIEDPETGEHHHPTVHYLFQDDDPEPATAAILESLASGSAGLEPGTTPVAPSSSSADATTTTTGVGPGSGDEIEERCILIDFAADGKTILGISSLSPEWQALKTRVSAAPSWGDEGGRQNLGGGGGGGEEEDEGETAEKRKGRKLMLTISGREVLGNDNDRREKERRGRQLRQKGQQQRGVEDLGDVIAGFDRVLGDLDGLLLSEESERRQEGGDENLE